VETVESKNAYPGDLFQVELESQLNSNPSSLGYYTVELVDSHNRAKELCWDIVRKIKGESSKNERVVMEMRRPGNGAPLNVLVKFVFFAEEKEELDEFSVVYREVDEKVELKLVIK
jgi:hypothetical protein